MINNQRRLHIHEVAVRDGLQIEPRFIPTDQKIALVDRLSRTGIAKIEVTSFASPKAIPALADAELVMNGIERVPGVVYSALVPNIRGLERAIACDIDEINLVMSASDSHGRANLSMAPQQSLAVFEEIVKFIAGKGPPINVALSTAFGCPFDGDVPIARILGFVDHYQGLGITGLSLCDTTGMANPAQVVLLCDAVRARASNMQLTVHFHNTRGMGLANALAALNAGIDRFDASLGGLGGCPFAPGATGNVCTEDLVHMFGSMDYDTGVELDRLLDIARDLPSIVGHETPGQVVKAGPFYRKYPLPRSISAQKQ